MKEMETFNDFYAKLSDIINSNFNLDEPICENKIVKKNLRSLLERFHAKVVAIEEHIKLNTLRVQELVENLQTFEANHCSTKKSKGIALISSKSARECSDVKSYCNSKDAEFKVVFAKKFKRFLKKKGHFEKRIFRKIKHPTNSNLCLLPIKVLLRVPSSLYNALNVKGMVTILLSVQIRKRKAKAKL